MKKILIVGGAGYIGSHMVWYLGKMGRETLTFDNLSSGHSDAVLSGELIVADLNDRENLDKVFRDHEIETVIHFASSIQVGESMSNPAKYYHNNIINGINLLDSMVANGVKQLIFSSTAAIFGDPTYTPIDEQHPKNPINTYGKTKLIFEQILEDYDRAYDLKSVCLRYFNAAGNEPDGLLGERHEPETHLIPLVLEAAAGKRPDITVFGKDYETPDGTCIRDYVHVLDLADAHFLALEYLNNGGQSQCFNLGNGNGYSVAEVIETVEKVTGRKVPVRHGARREGDPAILVANSSKIKNALGWEPKYSALSEIIQHAHKWQSKTCTHSA